MSAVPSASSWFEPIVERRHPAASLAQRAVVVLALGAAVVIASCVADSPASAAPVRLLAVGDSVTDGDGSTDGLGFRDDLYRELTGDGIELVMVGSMGENPYRGHFSGGKRIRQFYPPGYGNGWGTGTVDLTGDVSVLLPRVVLIHLGTNDINSYHTPFTPYSDDFGATLVSSAAGRLAELVSYVLQWGDGTRGNHVESVILSRIIPIHYRDEDVRAFNAEVEAMVEAFVEGSITGRPERVLLANHYGRFMSNQRLFTFGRDDWMYDDLHPNDDGYAQIAAVYADCVREALGDHEPPSAPELSAGARSGRALSIAWRAPGDDGDVGRALRYDLRFSRQPIDESNFESATRYLAEPEPATVGTAQEVRIDRLDPDRSYYVALRVIDNAANRAPLSVLRLRTTEDAGYSTDTFERPGIGEEWSRSPSVALADGEVAAPHGDAGLAHLVLYTPDDYVRTVEVVLGDGTAPDDLGGVGVAVRLDRPNLEANGYAVVREAGTPGDFVLHEIGDGRVVAELDRVESGVAAPGAGDRIGVRWDEADGAFLFKVYVNGTLDVTLRDAGRRVRAPKRYGGFILAGGAAASIDRVNLLRSAARAVPEPALPAAPFEGQATSRQPELRWLASADPNLGQMVRYAVHLSRSPSMAPADSTTGIETTSFTPATELVAETTYYWRVRAYDTTGRGSLSEVQSFVTTSGSAGLAEASGVDGVPAAGIVGIAPNPCNPSTRIRYRLEVAGPTRLAIYDVGGRLVTRLVDGPQPAGEHVIPWDGTNLDGRRQAAGIYFLALEQGGHRWHRKIVVAR